MPNPIEELVDRLLQRGRPDELEERLADMKGEGVDPELQGSWHYWWAVTAFHRQDRKEALRRFQEGFDAHPDSAEIRFSLAQELQHVGRAEEAFALLDDAPPLALGGSFALMAVRYAYLWGELDRGLAYLQPILDAYDDLGIVDDTFLHMRRLPFFGVTWSTLGALHELRGTLDELDRYTSEAEQRLSDYDFTGLKAFAEAVTSGDFEPVLKRLERSAKNARAGGWPSGYPQMQAAVLEALLHDAPAEGGARLDSLKLGSQDFPWLEDVRTLARMGLAAARGDQMEAAAHRAAFLDEQPLLFEPHHAFDFRLLTIQESLRPLYQEACRARRE